MAKTYPAYGFWNMVALSKRQHKGWNHKRLYRVYKDLSLNLLVRPKKRLPRRLKNKFVSTSPNQCWSLDFMHDSCSKNRRFKLLTVVDDYSRHCLTVFPKPSINAKTLTQQLDILINRYGHPLAIRTDNGPEFVSCHFRRWAQRKNIEIRFIQPGKPSQNALIERFNGTVRRECLNPLIFDSIRDVSHHLAHWIAQYNTQRPHDALSGKTPHEVFSNP